MNKSNNLNIFNSNEYIKLHCNKKECKGVNKKYVYNNI